MPKVKRSVTVGAPIEVVYGAWRNFENFPRFMGNIEEVSVMNPGRSHWKAKGPLGTSAEWDAEITLEELNRTIGWRSVVDAPGIETAGRVNFEKRGEGETELEVTIQYEAPGGLVGSAVTTIFSNPEQQVEADLQRFKETIEQGIELSGMRFGTDANVRDFALGGSMGGVTAGDLERISESSIEDPRPGAAS